MYPGRTLYATWDLSYDHLKRNYPDAAELLELLAYFSNQSLWYELFHAGISDEYPKQLREVITGYINFDSVMRTLAEHCFLESQPKLKRWSMHTCVHDWVLARLNKTIDQQQYWYAFDCVCWTYQ